MMAEMLENVSKGLPGWDSSRGVSLIRQMIGIKKHMLTAIRPDIIEITLLIFGKIIDTKHVKATNIEVIMKFSFAVTSSRLKTVRLNSCLKG